MTAFHLALFGLVVMVATIFWLLWRAVVALDNWLRKHKPKNRKHGLPAPRPDSRSSVQQFRRIVGGSR